MDLLAPSFVQFGPDGAEVCREAWPSFDRNTLFLNQLRHFFAACEGKESPSLHPLRWRAKPDDCPCSSAIVEKWDCCRGQSSDWLLASLGRLTAAI